MIHTDVLIAGAGPAGCATALALRQAGRSVLLAHAPGRLPPHLVEHLPGAARPLLRDLGVPTLADAAAHRPCQGTVSIWGDGPPQCTDAIRDPSGFGWHLDRLVFDADLRRAACHAGADLLPAQAGAPHHCPEGWTLQVGDKTVTARWLVDAGGRRATLARALGAVRIMDDDRVAVCAWLPASATGAADRRSWIEATLDGWWYSAGHHGHHRCAAVHLPAKRARALRDPHAFLHALRATDYLKTLVEIRGPTPGVWIRPAWGTALQPVFGAGWAAVGDATLTFDPIAAQGLFNALYGGFMLGRAIHARLDGDSRLLAAYAQDLEQVRVIYRRRLAAVYGQVDQGQAGAA